VEEVVSTPGGRERFLSCDKEREMTHSFQGKVALVLGQLQPTCREIAELLVDAGAEIVLASSDRACGQAFAQRLGTAVLYLPLDGLSEEQFRTLVAMTIEAFGRIDLLVISMR